MKKKVQFCNGLNIENIDFCMDSERCIGLYCNVGEPD